MSNEIANSPEYRSTLDRLESHKRLSKDGIEYWMAREIHGVIGYPTWREFHDLMERARSSFANNGVDPSHQIVLTHKMMEVGRGAKRQVDDYFLSRPACYLIAMNGDPAKPEIAACQAYFAVQTRRMEIEDQDTADEKRLELREKVAKSHRVVSGVAQDAGVRREKQGIFHAARYEGLYGMSVASVKSRKGLKSNELLYDRAGPMELSANDFQMNLATEVIQKDGIRGEYRVIQKNREVAADVRRVIEQQGGTLPEDLPLVEPIKEVKKRVKAREKKKNLSGPSTA